MPVGDDLHGLKVGILVADGVEQVEVIAPQLALSEAGADVRVLSPDGQAVRAYHYISPQDEIPVQGSIPGAKPDELDALVLPGGLGGPDTLRTDREAVELVAAVAARGKPIGVICHGPWLLVEAGTLKGRTLTCVPALRSDVTNAGAYYVPETTHVDGSKDPCLISGRNFEAADEFARTLVTELASRAGA